MTRSSSTGLPLLTHALGEQAAVKLSLKTGDDATARVRWNRVHEQVQELVQVGLGRAG